MKGKEKYKAIGICGFDYKLFEEDEGGWLIEGLYGYIYLKHLIKLCPGDWVKHMEKMNEMVGMNNHLLISGGNKWLDRTFTV